MRRGRLPTVQSTSAREVPNREKMCAEYWSCWLVDIRYMLSNDYVQKHYTYVNELWFISHPSAYSDWNICYSLNTACWARGGRIQIGQHPVILFVMYSLGESKQTVLLRLFCSLQLTGSCSGCVSTNLVDHVLWIHPFEYFCLTIRANDMTIVFLIYVF